MLKFDTKNLEVESKRYMETSHALAKDMGWSHTTQSSKLNGISYFNQYEIFKAAKLLGIKRFFHIPLFFYLASLENLNFFIVYNFNI